ncbi:MAG: sugar transferase [Gammaproteobacteria bacterium]
MRDWLKRLMDVSGAVIGLLVMGPLMFVIAVAIRITMGTPVLFSQMRPGFQGLPIEILKFRTMADHL